MIEDRKERVYRRGLREAARVPAVRAADAAGTPIVPVRDWAPVGSERELDCRAPETEARCAVVEVRA